MLAGILISPLIGHRNSEFSRFTFTKFILIGMHEELFDGEWR